jgi:putative transposase
MLWKDWKSVLIVVKPETVIRWHRKGFKLFWTFKSRKRFVGRSSLDPEIRKLIQAMARANPLWGAPRIHGELMKLGIEVHERTVSNIIKRLRTGKPPSQTWKTFLENHMCNTFAVDFFVVPTARFQVLYVLVIIWHETRQVAHFDVTRHPTSTWTAQQIVEACP